MTTRSDYIQMSDVSQEIWGQWNRNTNLNEDPVRILAQANRNSGTAITMDWLRNKTWWVAPTAAMDELWFEDTYTGQRTQQTYTNYLYLTIYNGSGNFSVSYSIISGGGFTIVNTSDKARAVIQYTVGKYGANLNAVLRATITDNSNGYVFTKDVNLHVYVYDGQIM